MSNGKNKVIYARNFADIKADADVDLIMSRGKLSVKRQKLYKQLKVMHPSTPIVYYSFKADMAEAKRYFQRLGFVCAKLIGITKTTLRNGSGILYDPGYAIVLTDKLLPKKDIIPMAINKGIDFELSVIKLFEASHVLSIADNSGRVHVACQQEGIRSLTHTPFQPLYNRMQSDSFSVDFGKLL